MRFGTVLLGALLVCASHALLPMYEPGATVNVSTLLGRPNELMGTKQASLRSCHPYIDANNVCPESGYPTSRVCAVIGGYYSRIALYTSDVTPLGTTLEVDCAYDNMAPAGTRLVYSTNGTFPNVFAANETEEGVTYDFPATISLPNVTERNGSHIVLMRCVEPGLYPSPFSYWRNLPLSEYSCDDRSWTYSDNWANLDLPNCDFTLYDCDGQTIYPKPSDAPEASPSPPQEPPVATPAPPTTEPEPSEAGAPDSSDTDSDESSATRLHIGASLAVTFASTLRFL